MTSNFRALEASESEGKFDLSIVEKSLTRLKKLAKTGNKDIVYELNILEKIEVELNQGNFLNQAH